MNSKPETIIISGSQTEAWIVAALYAKSLSGCQIKVIGKQIADPLSYNLTPENLFLIQHLGMDEQTFLRQSTGCFNLGTLYESWADKSHSYFQPFGPHGGLMDYVSFQHYAIKQHLSGTAIDYENYSLASQAARQDKFARPKMDSQTILATLIYAITFNGNSLVDSLKSYCGNFDVEIIDTEISEVLIGDDGEIEKLLDSNGDTHIADVYLDCSGQARSLISALPGFELKTLTNYFKADKIIQWQTNSPSELKPFATIKAIKNGWLRQVSDKTQCLNQYYFDSDSSSNEDAITVCRENGLDSDDYLTIDSTPAVVDTPWLANCIALGESAGYIEPLDSSNLHSLITSAFRLLELFPRSENWGHQRYEYNRKTLSWYDNLCNMNIHRYCGLNGEQSSLALSDETDLPEAVERKTELFMDNGQIAFLENEPFADTYQVAMFLGVNRWPSAYDPLVDNFDIKGLDQRFNQMRQEIDKTLSFMPSHLDFLTRDLAS